MGKPIRRKKSRSLPPPLPKTTLDTRTSSSLTIVWTVLFLIVLYSLVSMFTFNQPTSSLPLSFTWPSFSSFHTRSLYWGTYRPGLYIGIRSRSFPLHLSTGLLWSGRQNQVRSFVSSACFENK